ncbi:AAA domain-containing protein [Paenibacillus gallinarum]|uniref:AAA family ATPase n=1 Tax=Paenibacillus gallinarum TaxID=2762232 RepID=A0ABR8T4B0_9BACL|nr:ATP-binding protein [Paenibacillus gallinarum]MBD7970425.1 AAA family ATPase [Paenibacillus gallinarum]
MKATDISFGQQHQYNARINVPLEKSFEGRFVKMIPSGGGIFLVKGVGANSLVEVILPENSLQNVIYELEYYKEACIVRIDAINYMSILFTIIKFSQSIQFNENEALKFVINKAIEADLKKLSVHYNPIDFFKEEFLVEDICFARTKNLDKITLIGTKYTCVFQKTSQNIMQAIEIKPLRNRSAINGTIIVFRGFISFQDHLNNAQLSIDAMKKYHESLKDTHELLKLWNLYSELETELAKEQIEELGSLIYTSTFSKLGGNSRLKQVFYLDKKPSSVFIKSDRGYAVSSSESFISDDITSSRSFFIGSEATLEPKRQSGQYELTIELEDENITIPPSGYLMGSFTGSKKIAERREKALNKILDGKNPLVNLKIILQSGVSEQIVVKHKAPVTEELLRKIFGTKKMSFTERQREAIDIAINTPDIAIIQGPPGTGKTTVIRAIIARLNTVYDGNIRILVSSAQHDAVDNAIENVEYGGLPVNRIGGKKANYSTDSEQSILKWISAVTKGCEEVLNREENGQERIVIREILMILQDIYKHKKNQKEVQNYFKQMYPLLKEITVHPSIVIKIEHLIKNTRYEKENTYNMDQSAFVELLQKQRVTIASYMDDGRYFLSQLVRFVQSNLEIDVEIPDIWNELRLAVDEEEVNQLLPKFRVTIESLIDQFNNDEPTITLDENLFDLDVDSILTEIHTYFEDYFYKGAQTVSDILWDFKDQLENPEKITQLINKYTKINAATCQQSVLNSVSTLNLDLNKSDKSNIVYDYVIIDEAARANPLDLLIPMSLGKHIILVGDHKQLPHLLEEDVIGKLLEHKNDPEIRELLKEPLFSRLYNMLEKTKNTSHARTVMLKDQYRMHPKIAQFISECFYENSLSSGVTAEQRQHNLDRYNNLPIAWIDVPQSFGQESTAGGQSKSRKYEVDKVMEELQYILNSNTEYSIGIISFYKKQVMDLQREIEKLSMQDQVRIKVGTVDAFQGKEFDVVILSTVRSNNRKDKKKSVGFLDSRNRLNVAFSRGRRLIIVVGDVETVALKQEQVIIKELHDFYQLCRKEGYYEHL